jgi:DNA-directed RNA polymerase specialized sigma54-like protein
MSFLEGDEAKKVRLHSKHHAMTKWILPPSSRCQQQTVQTDLYLSIETIFFSSVFYLNQYTFKNIAARFKIDDDETQQTTDKRRFKATKCPRTVAKYREQLNIPVARFRGRNYGV